MSSSLLLSSEALLEGRSNDLSSSELSSKTTLKTSFASAGFPEKRMSEERRSDKRWSDERSPEEQSPDQISLEQDKVTETVSDYLCRTIANEGVDSIFLVPGGFVDNLCHSIAESPDLNAYVAASEGGAAMMADGYARVSNRFGVCMAIAGPGASNMITGLSLSQVDEIPVLAITGESPSDWRNRGSIQDCGSHGLNTTNLLGLVAQSQYQISEPALAPQYLKRCMRSLAEISPGVVHLSIPMEQQASRLLTNHRLPLASKLETRRFIDLSAIEQALDIIKQSARIALLVGPGLRKNGAFDALLRFAEAYTIPVATTMDAKGDFPEDHPLSLGVFGWAGSRRANELLTNDDLDCLFVIGTKLGQVDTMGWSEKISQNRNLIQLSNKESDLGVTYEVECSILADVEETLNQLNSREPYLDEIDRRVHQQRRDWLANKVQLVPVLYDYYVEDLVNEPIHPARVIQKVQEAFPLDSRVFVDNGAHTFFATHYWLSTEPNHFFSAIKYSGAMGWAVPASVGAHIAKPASKTVVFVGDGCMLMHGIEIQTAVKYGLKNMVFVVLNNKAHGNPKLRAVDLSEKANHITDIADHDWARFAQSLGLKGMAVSKDEDLGITFKEAVQIDDPILIDVKCGLYPTPTKIFDELFMSDFKKNTINRD